MKFFKLQKRKIIWGIFTSMMMQCHIGLLNAISNVEPDLTSIRMTYAENATLKHILHRIDSQKNVPISDDLQHCLNQLKLQNNKIEIDSLVNALPEIIYFVHHTCHEMVKSWKAESDVVASRVLFQEIMSAFRALNYIRNDLSNIKNTYRTPSYDVGKVVDALDDLLYEFPFDDDVNAALHLIRATEMSCVGICTNPNAGIRAIVQCLCQEVGDLTSSFTECCDTLNSKLDIIMSKIDLIGTDTTPITCNTFTIESKLDQCCFTINSKLDALSSKIDSITTVTVGVVNINSLESKLDACCFTLNSKVDEIVPAVNTVSSKLDQCCFTLSSKIDALSVLIAIDFAGTFTAIAAVDRDVLTVSSKLDQCCFALNSKLDTLTTTSSFNACCFTLNSKIDQIIPAVNTVSSKLDQCCFTLNSKVDQVSSKIDALSALVAIDFAGTFTAIAAVDRDVLTVSSKVDAVQINLTACCFNLNSKLDIVNSKIDSITTVTVGVVNIASLESKLDACCFTLNSKVDLIVPAINTVGSKVDALSILVATDFAGTFTAIAAVERDVLTVSSKVDAVQTSLTACCFTVNSKLDSLTTTSSFNECCFTLNSKIDQIIPAINIVGSKVDALSILVATDFAGTFTAIAAVDRDVLIVSSKVDALSILVATDFAGTFTAIAAVDRDVLTVSSKLDQCCFTLNSKIDTLQGTFILTSSTVGTCADPSFDSCYFTTTCQIDTACLSVISWLKTIYRDLRGFVTASPPTGCPSGPACP